ncbi:MAG: single-stranded-DNA-specific exonuclease RecJ [Polyangiaceae bacterium]|nr:single-stranded-DNA-specific exonuclease RecJ [Polyangiaceae bacterium]MCW5789605.1 single-stranded-DNA-specific exonuclease RecJ [Polyangiaceae bacterium]
MSEVERLSRALGSSRTLAQVFVRRGQLEAASVERFLSPQLSQLTLPDAMADREVLAERLAHAAQHQQRVVVFGDYDCDGITSAAILTDLLRRLGAVVIPQLASRFSGGYGVSPEATDRILAAKPAVLVTCDCGSSDHKSLSRVRDAGVDVLVIDHHLVPREPLPAMAFLNPHRPECGFPYKGLASCGLVLSLGAALRKRLDPKLDLRPYLDLVAIGTIADVAPLDGDNRALVRAGLNVLGTAARPGVRALLEYAKIDPSAPVRGEDVAFRIAPRINAPGRLGAPDPAFDLLLARNLDTARSLAARVEQLTDERKAIQQEMEEQAIQVIEREGWADRPALVIAEDGFNHGIVGVVAGRLVDRYQVPVVVIGFEGDEGRGSVRGPAGARLFDALTEASGPLTRFGGHQAAAGVTVQRSAVAAFREAFEAACGAGAAAPRGEVQTDPAAVVPLIAGDRLYQVVTDLERLEPCGERNPAPSLEITARLTSARVVGDGHLKLDLDVGGQRLSAFGFGQGELAGSLGSEVTLVGKLKRDTYHGGEAVELRIGSVQSAAAPVG